jgi:hypothetical protein
MQTSVATFSAGTGVVCGVDVKEKVAWIHMINIIGVGTLRSFCIVDLINSDTIKDHVWKHLTDLD